MRGREFNLALFILGLCFIGFALIGCGPTLQQRTLETPSADSKYDPPQTDTMVKVMDTIQHRLETEQKVTIQDIDEDTMVALTHSKNWGATDVEGKQILLLAGIPPDARFETLVHEAAHLFHPSGLERSAREVFAEEVMVKVSHYYGWDASDRSRRYLAQWKGGYASFPYVQLEFNTAVKAITGRQ